jgi:hypothetical protein
MFAMIYKLEDLQALHSTMFLIFCVIFTVVHLASVTLSFHQKFSIL